MESFEDPRDQGSQIFDSVSYAHDDHRRNADFPQVLLVLKIAVGRKDRVETGGDGRAKQCAIPQTKPILRVHSGDFESGELVRKLNRQRFVDQNAQAA